MTIIPQEDFGNLYDTILKMVKYFSKNNSLLKRNENDAFFKKYIGILLS